MEINMRSSVGDESQFHKVFPLAETTKQSWKMTSFDHVYARHNTTYIIHQDSAEFMLPIVQKWREIVK